MKYKLLLILSIFLPVLTVSQEPLLHPERLWSMVEVHCLPQGNTYTSHYLKTGRDTLIENETYKILRYSQDETQQDWIDYGGFIRETTDHKVYYKRSGLPEGLIYDFSASLGDTVVVVNQELIPEPLHMVVILEDSLFLEDGWHKMLVLEDENFPGEEIWIEGVGSVSGLVKSCLNAFGSACGDFDLLCSSDAGLAIYMNPEYPGCWYVSTRISDPELKDELLVFPNPVHDILNIEGEILQGHGIYTLSIIDHTGRLVIQAEQKASSVNVGHLPDGLYILHILTDDTYHTSKIVKR